MLTWKSEIYKKTTSFHGHVEGDAPIGEDKLVDMYEKVLDELEARAPEIVWDVLVCQLTTQAATVVVRPADKNLTEAYQCCFKVGFGLESWYRDYESLPDPEEDETKFDKAYSRLHKNQLRALKTAINDPRVKSRFIALKRRDHFAVFCVDEGDTPISDRMEFLWGNRPPKRDYNTAKELFEHLFRKLEIMPDYSMRLDGEKVIAVHWFSHNFTDKSVSFLAEIPKLAELCIDLKEFILTATRVTQSGVDRLKLMLPTIKFTIITDKEYVSGNNPWYQFELYKHHVQT